MKYIGFYGIDKNRKPHSIAALPKMRYISDTLNKLGIEVEHIFAGRQAFKQLPAEKVVINPMTSILYFKSYLRSKFKLIRFVNLLFSRIQLFFYCITKIEKDEEILVYHSLETMLPIYLAKRIKHFTLVLEVEEIYNDVRLKSAFSKKMEERYISYADKYIFPTKSLDEKYNTNSKPSIIIHGTYQVETDRQTKFDGEKIHVVYAGTFDPRKGGAIAAASGEFLDSRYHIHILGFGSEEDKKFLLTEIERVSKISDCTVTYDGLLSGEDYIRFIQKCHIGLSTQNPAATFNETSFPSKILSYMSNGLRVVSIKIPAIEKSAIGSYMFYYDRQTPEQIANAIKSVNLSAEYDGRKIVSELDEKFLLDLKSLLGD